MGFEQGLGWMKREEGFGESSIWVTGNNAVSISVIWWRVPQGIHQTWGLSCGCESSFLLDTLSLNIQEATGSVIAQ